MRVGKVSEVQVIDDDLRNCLKIVINGLIHVHLKKDHIAGFQTWIPDNGEVYHVIEFYFLNGTSMQCEYVSREIWEDIVSKLWVVKF